MGEATDVNARAPRTAEVAYHYLRAVLKPAFVDRMIPTSPGVGIKLPKPEPLPVKPLDVEQVEAIASVVPERYRVLCC